MERGVMTATPLSTPRPTRRGSLNSSTVSRIGDQDGDGYEDFAVGDCYYNTVAYHAGAVHIFPGTLQGPVLGSLAASAADGRLDGPEAYAYAGDKIDGAPPLRRRRAARLGWEIRMGMASTTTSSAPRASDRPGSSWGSDR